MYNFSLNLFSRFISPLIVLNSLHINTEGNILVRTAQHVSRRSVFKNVIAGHLIDSEQDDIISWSIELINMQTTLN